MKTFVILFTLFYFLNALAVAPYGIKGQQNGTTLYSNVHQFPNNQVTNLGGINALVETGNSNLLINPSFEHSSFFTGWSNLGTSSWSSDVTAFDGKASVTFSPVGQTVQLRQQSSINSAQLVGAQGLASIRVKSSVALKVCSFIDSLGATATNCVNVNANNKWGLYKVPFLMGATSSGISVESVGNVTGTIYIDDAFVGAVDLKADIDSSKIAGESYFAGTTSCTPTRSSATIGPFSTVSACTGPTIVEQNIGQWQTTDADLIRQTVNNLPAGKYKATFFLSQNVANTSSIAINDGTTTCEGVNTSTNSAGTYQTVVSCTFNYTSSGNRVFEIYGAAIGGAAVTIANNQSSPRASTKFILEYFGSGSVYSSTNADTDWASCTPTSSQGFTTPTFAIQCKRQGGDLLLKGNFTPTTTTAVEARIGLPLWNGVQLVSAGSSVIPSLQMAQGFYVRSPSSTSKGGSILIEPSVSYITFGTADTFSNVTASSLTKATGTAVEGSGTVSFNARIPIEGWQQSNIIIGQFNGLESCTDTLTCTDTFSAQISAAGVVSNESVDFINGNCTKVAVGENSCTFKTGIFTVAPNCVATAADRNNITGTQSTITTVSANTASRVSGAINDIITLVCQKQGVDYIGKTAKAVASDQNVRSIGSTGMDIQSIQFAGATISTACSTSPCVIYNSVGSKITSVTRNSAGDYNLNGIDGTKYICNGGGNATSYVGFSNRKDLSSSVLARIQFGSGVTPLDVNNASVTCIGIP